MTEADVVRDPGFAHRLSVACDGYPHAPPAARGRLTWLANELQAKFGTKVSIETTRKWFGGITRPKQDKMAQIAELLQVDAAWLSLGMKPTEKPKEREARGVRSSGAVNVIAGFIQLSGGAVAFPKDLESEIDFHAILHGEQFAITVRLGRWSESRDMLTVEVPQNRKGMTVLVMAPADGLEVEVYLIDEDTLAASAVPRGGYATLEAKGNRNGLEIAGRVFKPLRAIRDSRDLS